MNYLELYDESAAALKSAEIGNSGNEARWLVLETLGIPAAKLYSGETVPPEKVDLIRSLCARRCQHEPLQYLLGSAPFGEIELEVTPAVLIPRCETEVLVDYALEHLAPKSSMLDVGCGSGAIGILAACRRPDIQVTALDKSPEALHVAEKNAHTLGVFSRMTFLESDLLSALKDDQKFDLVAANLPYVTFDEYETLAPEVKDHEPQMALTAPDEGMELIDRLIESVSVNMKKNAVLVLEMSPHQTARAERKLRECGFEKISVFADQFGKMRFVAAVCC